MTEDNRPLLDNKAFNDPTAWGFCEWCAFDVAVYMGQLIDHRRYRNDHNDVACPGSGRTPPGHRPYVAVAKSRVNLRKEMDRARRKAYWQRQRFAAKATARRKAEDKAKFVTPTKITVTSQATGEEIDLTPMVVGPIVMHVEEESDGSTD